MRDYRLFWWFPLQLMPLFRLNFGYVNTDNFREPLYSFGGMGLDIDFADQVNNNNINSQKHKNTCTYNFT